jgi:hypothetical protein
MPKVASLAGRCTGERQLPRHEANACHTVEYTYEVDVAVYAEGFLELSNPRNLVVTPYAW